jgi:hypothetical protein
MISLPHFAQVAEFPSFEKCFHTQDDILVINTQQERKKKVAILGSFQTIDQQVNRV